MGTSLEAQWSRLCASKPRGVGELRFHTVCGVAQKKGRKSTMLTRCQSKGNKEIIHICGVGTQHPAQRVQQPSDDGRPAAPTGVNEQADERSCHRTLRKELTSEKLWST